MILERSLISVNFIDYTQHFDLRRDVLGWKAPYTIDADLDDTTFHLGSFYKEEIISIGTFAQQSNSNFSVMPQYRLRGMASNRNYSGLGAGSMLLEFAEIELRKRKIALLWFDARVAAKDFYKKLNYSAVGEFYPVRDVGLHQLMFKEL